MTIATDILHATEITDTEGQFGIPAGIARARGGLWLIELSDGAYATSYGDQVEVFLAAPLPVDDVEVAELVQRSQYMATRIVARVRFADDPHSLWADLATLSGQQLVALVVTLAAMVPPHVAAEELLRWTDDLDRDGRPEVPDDVSGIDT